MGGGVGLGGSGGGSGGGQWDGGVLGGFWEEWGAIRGVLEVWRGGNWGAWGGGRRFLRGLGGRSMGRGCYGGKGGGFADPSGRRVWGVPGAFAGVLGRAGGRTLQRPRQHPALPIGCRATGGGVARRRHE